MPSKEIPAVYHGNLGKKMDAHFTRKCSEKENAGGVLVIEKGDEEEDSPSAQAKKK